MPIVRSRAWLWTVQILLTVATFALLMTAAERSADSGSAALGALRFLLALFVAAVILTSLHESAHAVVGRLTGWRVFGMTIGRGPRLVALQIGSMRLELRGLLVGGATFAQATGCRSRDVSMLIAGLFVEATAAAMALVWSPASAWGQAFKWAIVLLACADVAINLWPRNFDTGDAGSLATDGAQLMTVLKRPDEWRREIEKFSLTRDRARLVQSLHGGDVDTALELARVEAAADPTDDTTGAMFGTLQLLAGHWRAAFDQLAPLADRPDAHWMVSNNAAWAAVMTFEPELLEHADRFSERALMGGPEEPACMSTRGATLALIGRPDDALQLLQRATAGRLTKQQNAHVNAFSALAEHRLGRPENARKLLATSRKLDRDCPTHSEVERLILLPQAPAATSPWPPPTAPQV